MALEKSFCDKGIPQRDDRGRDGAGPAGAGYEMRRKSAVSDTTDRQCREQDCRDEESAVDHRTPQCHSPILRNGPRW